MGAHIFPSCSLTCIKHYNHVAHEKTAARQTEYRAWVHSHTPEQIHAANNARNQLRRLLATEDSKGHPHNTQKIQDDRVPKKALSAYILYFKERQASGDFNNIKVSDAGRLAGEEWRSLAASEKKVCALSTEYMCLAYTVTALRGQLGGIAEQGACISRSLGSVVTKASGTPAVDLVCRLLENGHTHRACFVWRSASCLKFDVFLRLVMICHNAFSVWSFHARAATYASGLVQ